MRRNLAIATVFALGVMASGCGDAPTAPQSVLPTASSTGDGGGGITTASAGMVKMPIAGTLGYNSESNPGRMLLTPSGICHYWDYPVHDQLDGDVMGPVTFHEQAHMPCDFSRYVGSGPFEGEVTWNGRSGHISGQWQTNCQPDSSTPVGLSCDGTMNARGAGGLEGVQFHFKWGPGWYPFPYTGTVFSK